jgi:hypothetical protein
MNKISPFAISILLLILSGVTASGQIAEFKYYADDIGKDGTSLISHVESFKEYNDSGIPTKEAIRVVVVGAVKKPGVYYVAPGATMRDILQVASILRVDGFEAQGYPNAVYLYRRGSEPENVRLINSDHQKIDKACLNEDVINVRAVRL